MMSFAVLLLCAIAGLMVGSTLEQVNSERFEELSAKLEQALVRMSDIEKVSQMSLEKFEELSSKLEQALTRMSDIEKASEMTFDALSNRLRNEKDKLFVMNNDLLLKVFDLQKRDLETFETIANVREEAKNDRVRADLIQVRLNGTENMTHSCLASQMQIQETMQKSIERLDLIQESNLSARVGNVENSFKTLRQDLDYVSNRQDDTLKLTVQNNTNDIGQLKQELSRVETTCSPPCENKGQCVKNVCKCTPFFTGDSCQQTACSPPCENGGHCMRNNICKCTLSSYGDRCQNGTKCGVDFDIGGNIEGGNISSVLVWPWIAAVYSKSSPVCGGSVIHRHFVLTAAYCLVEYGSDGLSVKLGLSDLKKGVQLKEYRVHSVHMHPEFGSYDNYDYNIALLELKEPIPFGPFVRPVCLPSPEIPEDELLYKPRSTVEAVYISAYLSSPQTASPTMLNLTMLSQEECRKKIKETGYEIYYPSPELSFCAERPTRCPRQGSPVMQYRVAGDGARTWTQVGIRSGCSDIVGVVFIRSPRLDQLRAWVDSKITSSSKT